LAFSGLFREELIGYGHWLSIASLFLFQTKHSAPCALKLTATAVTDVFVPKKENSFAAFFSPFFVW
jgi:hypothetical protein